MSLKPNGKDEWPENLVIKENNFHDVFRLRWYSSELELEGFHNIPTVPNCKTLKQPYVQPAYSCPGCNRVVLVPFPTVENTHELYHFLESHAKGHVRKPIEVKIEVTLDDSVINYIYLGLLTPDTETIKKMAREIRVSRGMPDLI